jgi:hypothetical protein
MKTQNPLETFQGFDSLASEEDFFSKDTFIEEEEEETSSGTGDTGEEEEEEQGKTKPKKKEEEEEDMFSEISNQEEEDEEDDDTPKSTGVRELIKSHYSDIYDEEKDKDLTDAELFEKAIEARFEESFQELPDVAKEFNRFVLKGGNAEDFFKTIANQYSQPELTEKLDMTQEKNQELVIRRMLEKEGNDAEEIETQLQYYKDAGKLETLATKKFEKWKQEKQAIAAQMAQKRLEDARAEKAKIKEEKTKLNEILKQKDKIGDIPFTPEDKRKLSSYLIDKTVKLSNGSAITQFQKELYYDLPNNEDAFIQLGVMMRNRKNDGTFDFEAIKEELESNISNKARKTIRNSEGKHAKSSGGRRKIQKKSISEIFD